MNQLLLEVLVASLLMVACGGEPQPASPANAPEGATPANDPMAYVRQAEAEQAASYKAQQEQMAALQKQTNEAIAAHVQAKQKEHEDYCAKTRPVRATSVQLEAAAELKFQKDIEPKMAAIKARCRIPVKKELGNGSHGLEVRNQEQQTVCKGGPPKGISLDEATWALHRAEMPVAHLTIPAGEDGSPQDNRDCRELDLALGLDTQVTNGDRAGLEKLLAWRAPAP